MHWLTSASNYYIAGKRVTVIPRKATIHRLNKAALQKVFGAFGSEVIVHSNSKENAELEFASYSGWFSFYN